MHSDEVLVEAIKLRLKGTPVKDVATRLGVSVGWASANLSGIRPRIVRDRSLLVATEEELKEVESIRLGRRSRSESAFVWLPIAKSGYPKKRRCKWLDAGGNR